MARKHAETLDDLLTAIVPHEHFDDFAERAGIAPRTLLRLRRGQIARPHRPTVVAIATALAVPPTRVQAAIGATRAALGLDP